MHLNIPKNYDPKLDIRDTEVAIKLIKDTFESELANILKLTRVSAPLFVFPETGLNDNLNGSERPVTFGIKELEDKEVEIVHSLAKWKRHALKHYNFEIGQGLYTDMNAIRRDEEFDNLHSIYVDQWDWELVIDKKERNIETLKDVVRKIYKVFKIVEEKVKKNYQIIDCYLPDDIYFITSQELEDLYPELDPKQRENEISKKYGAVFIMQIGGALKSSQKHDNRAPDYDDWSLNGDMLFYYPILEQAMEVTSMGIRVDENSIISQLEISGLMDRKELPFHKGVINKDLPYTIGGGLGQSRICMFLLNKAHIGEVHVSIWPDKMVNECLKNKIMIL